LSEHIYSQLIKNGVLPEDIKDMIIEEFDDFFTNKKRLEENSINTLLPELINYLKLQKETIFYEGFLDFLEILNIAKDKDLHKTINAIESNFYIIEEAHQKLWIINSLERESSGFNLEGFSKYTFDLIVDVIEILIKPYCSYILYNIYIIKGKNNNLLSVKEKNLGNLINEIIQSGYLINILKPTINTLSGEKNIKLNTLRNIGAHNNYKVIEDEIICEIRNSRNEVMEQFKTNKEDLYKILIDVIAIFRALKLGYTLFFIDNIDYLNKTILSTLNPRKEQLILNTFFGIQSQGFEIIEFIDTKKESKLVLLELLENEKNEERAIHASQFLYYLWDITKSNTNIIEYRNVKNEAVANFEIDGNFCKKIEEGSIQMIEIAKEMKVKIHK